MGQAQTVAGRSAIVTQARLALAYDLRHERLSQEAIAKKMERAEKALVAEILTEYDAGTPIESGPAIIVTKNLGVRVDWRAEFVYRHGEAAAVAVEIGERSRTYRVVEMAATDRQEPSLTVIAGGRQP
jgi:hypothetical protein